MMRLCVPAARLLVTALALLLPVLFDNKVAEVAGDVRWAAILVVGGAALALVLADWSSKRPRAATPRALVLPVPVL